MSGNVYPMDPLAIQIRGDLQRRDRGIDKSEEGRKEWREATFDLCMHLAEARKRYTADIVFGQWCADNGFGENGLSYQDRAAALVMAENPEALRKCLEETTRISLRTIRTYDFSRFDNVVKPPKDSKQSSRKLGPTAATEAVREAVLPLLQEGKEVNFTKLATELHVSTSTVQGAIYYAEGVIEGKAQAKEAPPLEQAEIQPTMTQRYEATVRKAREEIRAEITTEVHASYNGMLDRVRERLARADRIIESHKGVMTRQEFRIVLAGLHPDHNKFEQAQAAFELFKKLEDVLVKPDAPVFSGPPLPATVAEMMARRRTRRR